MNKSHLSTLGALLKKLDPFFALSRTPHGIIDMSLPALSALLCLGSFPPLTIVLLGLFTVFSGYTAVYAVNDIVDYRSDRKKAQMGGYEDAEGYLDGVLVRHPMAKDVLSFKSGLIWAVFWSLAALAGAYLLNPVCMIIFLFGCLLEGLYCLLLRVTPLRAVVNGLVKTCGPLAAVYAVNPSPPLYFIVLLFFWVFLWEIGGQNIPADWTDMEEDRKFKAKTLPLILGASRTALIGLMALVGAMFLQFAVLWASPLTFGPVYLSAALCIAVYQLLLPSLWLAQTKKRSMAMVLFNRASYYPLVVFGLVLCRMIIP